MGIAAQKLLHPVRGRLRVRDHSTLVAHGATSAFEGATGDENPFDVGRLGVEDQLADPVDSSADQATVVVLPSSAGAAVLLNGNGLNAGWEVIPA